MINCKLTSTLSIWQPSMITMCSSVWSATWSLFPERISCHIPGPRGLAGCFERMREGQDVLIHQRRVWFRFGWTKESWATHRLQGSWLEWAFYWSHLWLLATTGGLSPRVDYVYRSCPSANLSPFGKHLQHVSGRKKKHKQIIRLDAVN